MGRSWKDEEKRIARLFGGLRRGVTGLDTEDCSHPIFSIEVKQRKLIPGWLTGMLAQAATNCPKDRIPLVTLQQGGSQKRVILMELPYFLAIMRECNIVPGGALDPDSSSDNPSTRP
jgi:hypothetical protein